MLFGKKKTVRVLDYDRNEKTPVIHCSICNGEQVGMLKDKRTGEKEEIMLIRNQEDLETFRKMVGTEDIPREY